MIREEVEFQIAQYADGSLPADQRPALEAVLAADAEARALLAEYAALNADLVGLKADAAAAPAVRWDALADHLSAAVARQAEARVSEDVEFAIAGYANGTLGEAERPAVEARLANDPAARTLFGEYEAVDRLAKRFAPPPPAVRWEALADRISDAIHGHAAAAATVPEDVEFAIAEYAEGTLPEQQRAAVEARLADDPAARLLLADYVSLDRALQVARAAPLPGVRWDRLAAHLSDVVAEADAIPAAAAGAAADTRSYRMSNWLRVPSRLAIAASVLVATALGISVLRSQGPLAPKPDSQVNVHPPVPPPPPPVLPPEPERPIVLVEGPTPEQPAGLGASVAEITIGPPAGHNGFAFADDLATRPRRATVASGTSPSDAQQHEEAERAWIEEAWWIGQ